MRKMKLVLLFAVAVIMVMACSPQIKEDTSDGKTSNAEPNKVETNDEDINEEIDHEPDVEEDEANSLVEASMVDFLLPEGSKAHFKGEGNEFAELDVEVKVANDTYAIIDEDNGGSLVRTIYSIQQDRIDIVSTEVIDHEKEVPTSKEVSEMKSIEIYLQSPFEKDNAFGEWTIIDTSATVETPYETFKDAIVIESSDKDFVNRKYFVQGYGEVKRETIMETEEEEDFIVISTLESLE